MEEKVFQQLSVRFGSKLGEYFFQCWCSFRASSVSSCFYSNEEDLGLLETFSWQYLAFNLLAATVMIKIKYLEEEPNVFECFCSMLMWYTVLFRYTRQLYCSYGSQNFPIFSYPYFTSRPPPLRGGGGNATKRGEGQRTTRNMRR